MSKKFQYEPYQINTKIPYVVLEKIMQCLATPNDNKRSVALEFLRLYNDLAHAKYVARAFYTLDKEAYQLHKRDADEIEKNIDGLVEIFMDTITFA